MKGFDLAARMEEFERWHQHPANRRCHDVGIPAVTLPVLGVLSWVKLGLTLPVLGELDLALVLLAATFVFDLFLSWRLAPFVLAMGLLSWAVARELPGWALAAIFAIGWVFQLTGHRVVEKNAPAFTDNAIHAVVGPRWLVNRWFHVLPKRPPPR